MLSTFAFCASRVFKSCASELRTVGIPPAAVMDQNQRTLSLWLSKYVIITLPGLTTSAARRRLAFSFDRKSFNSGVAEGKIITRAISRRRE